MATTATNSIRFEAEAVSHDVAATVATFRHPRYEVPAFGAILDGPEAVTGLVSSLMSAFPDFYLHKNTIHHADDAVIVEDSEGRNAAFGRALNRLEKEWK